MGPTTGYQDVSGQQELTYTPTDVLTATSTQTLPNDEVYLAYQKGNTPEEKLKVVEEILKVFPDAPIMVEVARCESNLNPAADRKGIDGGLFQINQIHLPKLNELGLDRYDLQDNLTYARLLFDQAGLQPWYMSEHCWG